MKPIHKELAALTSNKHIELLTYFLQKKYIDGSDAWEIFSDNANYKINNSKKIKPPNIKYKKTGRIHKNTTLKTSLSKKFLALIDTIASRRKCKPRCRTKDCHPCTLEKAKHKKLLYSLAKQNNFTKDPLWLTFNTEELLAIKRKIFNHLFKLQDGLCCYCKRSLMLSKFGTHIEHIKPKAAHPSKTLKWRNMALACVDCNFAKGDKYVTFNPNCDDINSTMLYNIEIGNHRNMIRYVPLSNVGVDLYEKLELHLISTKLYLMRLNADVFSSLTIDNNLNLNIYSDALLNYYCNKFRAKIIKK